MTEVEQPPQNGIGLSANEEDESSKARPADIEQVISMQHYNGNNNLMWFSSVLFKFLFEFQFYCNIFVVARLKRIDFSFFPSAFLCHSICIYARVLIVGYARNGTAQTCRGNYGLQTLP